MFKVIQNGPSRLDISMSGKLNSDEMIIALNELVSKSENIENGKMLYDVIDFHLPSLRTIVIEFSRLPSMFGLMKKFDRAAVLTDKTWLKKVSEFEVTAAYFCCKLFIINNSRIKYLEFKSLVDQDYVFMCEWQASFY